MKNVESKCPCPTCGRGVLSPRFVALEFRVGRRWVTLQDVLVHACELCPEQAIDASELTRAKLLARQKAQSESETVRSRRILPARV